MPVRQPPELALPRPFQFSNGFERCKQIEFGGDKENVFATTRLMLDEVERSKMFVRVLKLFSNRRAKGKFTQCPLHADDGRQQNCKINFRFVRGCETSQPASKRSAPHSDAGRTLRAQPQSQSPGIGQRLMRRASDMQQVA